MTDRLQVPQGKMKRTSKEELKEPEILKNDKQLVCTNVPFA